ncbi:Syntaxin-binding protein 5-like [Morella rubra]|uniref:Syntaxin-binding protein 5-like n=1 Tax=Morella rubra TaxID=262757 RepID=A0A6A1VXM5_9ROSI|nr:Syntaxin-binding protein 5-like [Morella rubra]
MFAKFFQKGSAQQQSPQGCVTPADLDPRVTLHYGIPSTASILAFDRIQSLLALGTLDGRIKVIGGDHIEAVLTSPKQLPFKNLEFLQNQGFLVGISNENEIQVWDLEHRQIASTLQWESNITAFSVINGTTFILLIAYQNGLMVLWDASEDCIVLVRGHKDLLLKDKTAADCQQYTRNDLCDDVSDDTDVEKEISSLCWASNNGSVLAVGYVDGDIIFWNLPDAASNKKKKAEKSSNDVVKLQVSSANRRLPIIVLHWAANKSHNDCRGQLFVYGGDEVGSEEVLTILNLDWSSGIECLKCIGRVDIALNGFADMVLLPRAGVTESSGMSLVALTIPGKLHLYNDACLSSLISQKEKEASTTALQYPTLIPTLDPYMTVAKLGLVSRDGKLSRLLSEIFSAAKLHVAQTGDVVGTKWPLTGGVPSQLLDTQNYCVERLYISGYGDGSVRVWDATYPALSLIYTIGSEVNGNHIAGASASVSALDFCSDTLTLAIGNECGLVHLYKLIRSSDEKTLHVVTETENEGELLSSINDHNDTTNMVHRPSPIPIQVNHDEVGRLALTGVDVHNMHQEGGPQCIAVFALINSRVCTLHFENSGSRLAVGFECGRVALLHTSTLSVLFITDYVSDTSSPVVSLAMKTFSDTNGLINRPEDSESKTLEDLGNRPLFVMTRNARITAINSQTGKIVTSQSMYPEKDSTAISMYIIGNNFIADMSSEKHSLDSPRKNEAKSESAQTNLESGITPHEVEIDTSTETVYFGQQMMNLFFLLCCEDALLLFSLKSLIEGDNNSIWKVNLGKPCCWTTTFRKDEKDCGLVVLYQSGVIEIRSLPTLEVLVESSLVSLLRWNFKHNMEKTMSSSNNGQIILLEAIASGRGTKRFPSYSFVLRPLTSDYKILVPRIPESLPNLHDEVLAAAGDASISLSPNQKNRQVALINLDAAHGVLGRVIKSLKVDDIKIDEPIALSSSSQKANNEWRDKSAERERLFEGASTETTPRLRTAEEIRAKYRKTGEASAAAAEARDKLAERGEKLERLGQRTEELRSGAENFASMASELAKTMERRKWWNI